LAAGAAESQRHAAAVRYCHLVARGLDRLDEQERQALLQRLIDRIVVERARAARS
jgi:hypothetical protein